MNRASVRILRTCGPVSVRNTDLLAANHRICPLGGFATFAAILAGPFAVPFRLLGVRGVPQSPPAKIKWQRHKMAFIGVAFLYGSDPRPGRPGRSAYRKWRTALVPSPPHWNICLTILARSESVVWGFPFTARHQAGTRADMAALPLALAIPTCKKLVMISLRHSIWR